jgi:hypothetical protein
MGNRSSVPEVPGRRQAAGSLASAEAGREPAVEVALLDTDGVIVSVNEAWDQFCRDNGGDLARAGVGVSYLEVCASAAGDPVADTIAEAILTALAGDLPCPVAVRVPCDSSNTARIFDVLVSSRLGDDGSTLGATVTLSESLAASADRGRPQGASHLGDDLINDLQRVGMRLHTHLRSLSCQDGRDALHDVAQDIDRVIQRTRAAIFNLPPTEPAE